MLSLEALTLECLDLSHLKDEDRKAKLNDLIKEAVAKPPGDHKDAIAEILKGLEFLNVNTNIPDISSRITIFDFFTYCCINCMHILPDLEAVESEFGNKITVVGIHSAKFENEKSTHNILSAVEKYGIKHPVVNDKNCILWKSLCIRCWPTVVVFGPGLRPLVVCCGEGHRQTLIDTVNIALEIFGSSDHVQDPVSVLPRKRLDRLYFPSKIALLEEGGLLVSDSGNDRILVLDSRGNAKRVIGCGKRGFQDGPHAIAQFNQPQGLCTLPCGTIIVADTGNHRIRMVDASGNVTTLVGTGEQGHDLIGGNAGLEQPIASPWDVALYQSQDGDRPNVLFIAMAGTHQIWGYFSRTQFGGRKGVQKGTCAALVGSGSEENRNNSYPHKVGLAQPSGLAVDSSEKALYVADSESSTIRRISLLDGSCKGVCGGEKDPTNLFAFGDVDGPSATARLQHPLDVVLFEKDLLVADSYNHKVKRILRPMVKDSICTTLVGGGSQEIGEFSEIQLNEPGGLCIDPLKSIVYIADTNAHRILRADLFSSNVDEVVVNFQAETTPSDESHQLVLLPSGGEATLRINLIPAKEMKLNDDIISEWEVTGLPTVPGKHGSIDVQEFKSGNDVFFVRFCAKETFDFTVAKSVFGCINDMCIMKEVVLKFEVAFKNSGKDLVEFQKDIYIE